MGDVGKEEGLQPDAREFQFWTKVQVFAIVTMKNDSSAAPSTTKILICVLIMVSVGLIHAFRLGQLFSGPLYTFYYGYVGDIVLPLSLYFMLALNDSQVSFLKPWYVKAGIVFTGATLMEILQYFGIYALGVTFDPLDILMYGVGVLLAALIEVKLFARYLKSWKHTK